MLDKAKNYLIVFLLVAVIASFFYGRHTAKSEVPALAVTTQSEGEKKSEEKKDITNIGVIKKTAKTTDLKAGTVKEETSGELLFEQDHSISVSSEKYKEMQQLISNPVKPRWAYGIGYGKEFEQAAIKERVGEYYSPKLGLRLIGDSYLLAGVGVNNKFKLVNGEVSLIILK